MLTAIAIVARNGIIGDGFDQPFKFAEDWSRFKKRTKGHALIMGRKTFDSIGVLPDRVAIVVSRTPEKIQLEAPNQAVSSFLEAVEAAEKLEMGEIFLLGGGQLYAIGLPYMDVLDITEVHADAEGSVKFPLIDPQIWQEVNREPRGDFDFVRYERRKPAL